MKNIEWIGDAATGYLKLLDQTLLPNEEKYLDCRTLEDIWSAIKRLSVRGAPAIGVSAAYGCVTAVQGADDCGLALKKGADYLATSRPTAVNLFWALERMQQVKPCTAESLLKEAIKIHEEDAAMCRAIGEHTLALIKKHRVGERGTSRGGGTSGGGENSGGGGGMMTHCNAGALATGGIGTATAGMYVAHEQGIDVKVYADETRPLLQGARLTAFELAAAGIDVTVICDGMAAQVMREGKVAMVIVGADRIASNGDAANKIGTYNLAITARHHNIPFYVAAPSSTFDMSLADGSQIPIEQRDADEVVNGFGKRTGAKGANVYNPAFDVTPADLITGIVTEKGLIDEVSVQGVKKVLG